MKARPCPGCRVCLAARAQQGSPRRDRNAPDEGRAGVGRRGVRRRMTPEAVMSAYLSLRVERGSPIETRRRRCGSGRGWQRPLCESIIPGAGGGCDNSVELRRGAWNSMVWCGHLLVWRPTVRVMTPSCGARLGRIRRRLASSKSAVRGRRTFHARRRGIDPLVQSLVVAPNRRPPGLGRVPVRLACRG